MGKYETGITFVFRRPVELGRSTYDVGEFGEWLTLKWLRYREIPENEVWGLRKGDSHGSRTHFYRTPAIRRTLWSHYWYMLLWLERMVRPIGLYQLDEGEFHQVLANWEPYGGEWDDVARFVAAIMANEGWLPVKEAQELVRRIRKWCPPTPEGAEWFPHAFTPLDDFAILPLFHTSCYAGDYVLLKWRRYDATKAISSLVGLEVLEVKTGKSGLSEKQKECIRYLYTMAQQVSKLIDHPIEVEYKLITVDLIPRDKPYTAVIHAKTLLRVQGRGR